MTARGPFHPAAFSDAYKIVMIAFVFLTFMPRHPTLVLWSRGGGGMSADRPTSRPRRVCNLRSIFAAEFDNALGPNIVCQVPERAVSEHQFAELSDFIITTPKFARKVVTLRAYDLQILAFPLCWFHPKFDRGAFLFSLGFVLTASASIQPYKLVISKFASILESLEFQEAFVSQNRRTAFFNELLTEVYHQLTETAECVLRVSEANCAYLKILPELPPPAPIAEWMVPVPVRDLRSRGLQQQDWDVTLREVAAFIDGRSSARQIALRTQLSVRMVCRCLTQLVYYGCVAMLDMFQFTNVYVPVGASPQEAAEPPGCASDSAAATTTASVSRQPRGLGSLGSSRGADPNVSGSSLAWLMEDARGRPVASPIQVVPHGLHRLAAIPELAEACCRYVQVVPAELVGSPGTLASGAVGSPEAPVLVPAARLGSHLSPLPVSQVPRSPQSPPATPAAAADEEPAGLVTPALVMRLYAELHREVSVAEHCLAPGGWYRWGIDPRRLVTFGLVNGLIRRVHEYPVGRLCQPALQELLRLVPEATLRAADPCSTGLHQDEPLSLYSQLLDPPQHDWLAAASGSIAAQAEPPPPCPPKGAGPDPGLRGEPDEAGRPSSDRLSSLAERVIEDLFDGRNPLDAACCRLGLAREPLLRLIEMSSPDCVIICR